MCENSERSFVAVIDERRMIAKRSMTSLGCREPIPGWPPAKPVAAKAAISDRYGVQRHMSRIVLVSNRVLDPSKASRAGGVPVVLANIARARAVLWFGWNGEVMPASEVGVVAQKGCMATASISDTDYAGYYLGYANSVLWPVFHNRLDLAKFEAGFFQHFVEVKRRFAGLFIPMLVPNALYGVTAS